MKKTVCCVLAIILILSFSSCTGNAEYTDRVIKGTDSYATLRMSSQSLSGDKLDDNYFDSVAGGCGRLVAKCDRLFLTDSEDSQLYALNHKVDVIVSPDSSFVSALNTAINMATVTDGAYSPTMGAVKALWRDGETSDDDLSYALQHAGVENLSVSNDKIEITDNECFLDMDGIKEGFVAQRLMEYLSAADVSYGIVSAGDSIGVFGNKPDGENFKIGIRHPENGDKTIAYYSIGNGFISICCDEDGTVIDPADGYPADSGIIMSAVWSNNGAISDALSEAAVILGEAEVFKLYLKSSINFEAILINEKGEIILTTGIEDEAFELSDSSYTVRYINNGE